jgi:predicted esterase
MSGRRLRILCLHGFRTNARILQFQCRDVVRLLGGRAEFVFVDAPHAARGKAEPIVEQLFPGEPLFEWWNKNDETGAYEGLGATIDSVERACAERGPFDGVLGFSQGACLAATLLERQVDDGAAARTAFRFGIIVSGFVPRDRALRTRFEARREGAAARVAVPVLLCRGAKDYYPATLAPYFADARETEHGGGHELPTRKNAGEAWFEACGAFLDRWATAPATDGGASAL